MASVGICRPLARTNPRSSGLGPPGLRALGLIALSLAWSGGAQAQCTTIAIAGTTLDRALISLAQQTGADIATTESGLGQVRVPPVSGCLSLSRALALMTRGSGYRAVRVPAGGYRIVRARPSRAAPVQPAADPPHDATELIVTGTKQETALLRFPGSVYIVDAGDFSDGIRRSSTLDDLARLSPIMQKTELGIGRNKLFIRGISDSSFNGPTQSTATVYFGDVQLNYSGPEPGIHLADMERVEILEGPQETLYGSGAISGIIRLAPRAVDLDSVEASAIAGATLTQGGAPGFDATTALNVPLVRDKLGLRLVGYRVRDGGYVDDAQRGAANINRTDMIGGRATLRLEVGDGWSVETGVLAQRIDAQDAAYAEMMVGPLSRRSALAQPYMSSVTLWRGVVEKEWAGGLRMVSASGLVTRQSSDRFDATRLFPPPGPIFYQEDNDGLLLNHETRFSRTTDKGLSWVAGIALLYDRGGQSRVVGAPGNPIEIIGVTNKTRSGSLFGEVTIPLSRAFAITAGARGTVAQTQGEPSLRPREEPADRGFPLTRIQPAIAWSWLVAPRLSAYGRFQTGYRTGGLAVARGIGRIAAFRPDSVNVGEVGLRRERGGPLGLAFSTAVSLARWKDIQADLFSRRSQPYTDNIGDATIVAVEAVGDWIPLPGLRSSFALLWTQNRTSGPLAGTSPVENRHLPDTPSLSGNLGLDYDWYAAGHQFSVGAAARYVGRSVLGTGSFLDISQGDYALFSAAGSWRWRNLEASINLDNLTNESASKFAMGNPLIIGFREQTVPVRPRSVRVAVGVRW